MRWGFGLSDFGLTPDGIASTKLLDWIECSLQLDLIQAPVLDAIEECGMEARRYGPVLATVVRAMPEEGRFNRVLGAAEPGAVEEGHLEEALEWIESTGVEARVPLTPGRSESAAAEALLERRGYARAGHRVRFVRPPGPPDFPEPLGIAVVEVEEFVEGFSDTQGTALGIGPIAQTFLDRLPGRPLWRAYVAYDKDGGLIASALTFRHRGLDTLAFAGTREEYRGQGAHLALVRRGVADATGPHCDALCAEVELSAEEAHEDPHPAIRNLVRAGFKQAAARPVWTP